MNCELFNGRLPEYVDETLSAAEQAAVREHFQKCAACQRTFAQKEAFAKSIRLSFHRDTQRLSLRPETKRNILNALQRPVLPPTAWENIGAFFSVLWRHPLRAGAVLVCIAVCIFGGRFHRQPAMRAKDDRITYVLDVPIQTETHVYRRQNDMVVDAVVTGVAVINGSFSENN